MTDQPPEHVGDPTPRERSVADEAFYEWLLSDHPAAKGERDRRRQATHHRNLRDAANVQRWAQRINRETALERQAGPEFAQALRRLAAATGPLADRTVARAAQAASEPDDAYVTRLRREWEDHVRAERDPGYRYPARLTGPAAAHQPPPAGPAACADHEAKPG